MQRASLSRCIETRGGTDALQGTTGYGLARSRDVRGRARSDLAGEQAALATAPDTAYDQGGARPDMAASAPPSGGSVDAVHGGERAMNELHYNAMGAILVAMGMLFLYLALGGHL